MTRTLAQIDEALSRLQAPPRDTGTVNGLVLRPTRGTRKVVDQVVLTPEKGIIGDRWSSKPHKSRDRQVSAIRTDVLSCLSGNAAEALSGDNLHVDFDLSEHNLPAGSEVAIGNEVLLRVSPEFHGPCHLFQGRFGEHAYAASISETWRPLRGRGVLFEVIHGGEIQVGDTITVVKRASLPKSP